MRYEDYLRRTMIPPRSLRRGQWAFNLLYELRPDLARRVVGTPLDPFHNDYRLPTFFGWVGNNWDQS